jgi:hypothetical protein
MRLVRILVAAVALAGLASPGLAQQPGEIFGKVTDNSGAVVPGVTVTLSGPVLLQPQVAVTSASGSYRFPGLAVSTYALKFEIPGFATLVRDKVRIEIGANVQINAALQISSVQETVTVSGETPVVDLRDSSKTSRFNQEALQSIPSARDPWVIIEQAAGVAMDRQNVGGSASGQQSNFVARGAAMREQKWNLDGVDITDMSATGGSPVYFDFDAFEEMQISAGGADVTMQSPGVAVNLVTKSGTDKFRGSGRWYITDQAFQSINVTDELRRQGATTGNPIQRIVDYGAEVGGPVKRGKAWFWGSYGRQDVSVGVNNFYKDTPDCQAMKTALAANPTAVPVSDVRDCLNSDSTLLNNYNAKLATELFRNNQFSFLFNAAEKVRNARDASDLRPLETTYRQLGVTRKDLGSSWWKTGMPKTYKWSDRYIFSDRLMAEVSYAHIGNNFALTFHDESLRDVQPAFEISTGAWSRSYQEAVYVRPTDSVEVVGNYFVPGFLGGDHTLKFGVKYRNDIAHTESMWGGDMQARFTRGVPTDARIYRKGYTEYGLENRSFYLQDTFARRRFTLNFGFRFDHQTDYASAANVEGSAFYGKSTYAGVYNGTAYTGAAFAQLPALAFPGAQAGVAFNNWSPRVGLTYDLTGNGRSVVKLNFAHYVGQLGTGDISSTYNTVQLVYVQYPWVDLNNDRFVQANEVVMTGAPLQYSTGYDYLNPTKTTAPGTVDPNLSADTANEVLVTFDHQLAADFAVSASYIWRKYQNFRANDRTDFGPGDWTAVRWTPPASACPSGASCPEVTYYVPNRQIPVAFAYTNVQNYWRGYQGVEFSARKRMSNNWMMAASFSFNDAPVHVDSPAGYVGLTDSTLNNTTLTNVNGDPTNMETSLNGGQYAPESTTSGLGNVFVNARWILRVNGAYKLPWWDIQVAANLNSRSGYPNVRSVQTPARPNGAGAAVVYLDKRGDLRLPTFSQLDLRVDKTVSVGRLRTVVSMDVFNLLNGNVALSVRGGQNASNANQISSILAPRVLRFGFRVTF